ncbi:unnamed protein product [Ascophyllum nodosum]
MRSSRLDLGWCPLLIIRLMTLALCTVATSFSYSGWSLTLRREGTARCNVRPRATSNSNDAIEDSNASLGAMEAWLDEAGVDRRGSTRLRRFAGRGIGLEASRELERDSTVASIPLSCCLSSDPADAPHGSLRALAHAALEGLPTLARPAFQSTEAALDKDMVSVTLQVFLECTAGAFSEFAPWMGMLPRGSDLNLPALWPEDDLRPLEGTLVSREVRQCLTAAEVERRQVEASIVSVVGREGDDGGWGSGGEFLREVLARGGGTLEGRPTWAEWLHARCIVQSRAYRVGKRYLLIPLVDFANHDDDVAFSVSLGDGIFTELHEVVLTADRGYQPGQEVYASYGIGMDNAKRLFSFGFVNLSKIFSSRLGDKIRLPNEAFCDVELAVDPRDPLRTFKEGVLQEVLRAEDGAMSVGAVFPLRPSRPCVRHMVDGPARAFVDSFLPLMRLVALTPHECISNGIMVDACKLRPADAPATAEDRACQPPSAVPVLVPGEGYKVLARLIPPISQDNEREARRLLSEQCVSRLCTIDLCYGDLDALRGAADHGDESGKLAATEPRQLLIAAVRVGEAMACQALLEAGNSSEKSNANTSEEDKSWASWVSEQCRSAPKNRL